MNKLYKKDEILKAIKLVSDRMMTLSSPDNTEKRNYIVDMKNWQWAQGVGLYGMFRCYELTKDEATLNYLINWYDAHLEKGLPDMNVNTTMPMLTMALLYEVTGKRAYYDACRKWADDLIELLPRTEQNGFQHCDGPIGDKYFFECTRSQLWADTVYMLLLFLAKAGQMFNESRFTDEAVRQMLLHLKYLYDKNTGLWYHVWSFDGRTNFTKALWARGNCWFTACMVDFLDYVKVDGGTRLYLSDSYLDQLKALKRFQHEDGAWSTLVDQMDTYKETSGTAGFAYGILKAERTGFIPGEYREMGIKALDYVLECISDDGTVQYVTSGTGLSRWDITHYKTVGMAPMAYGQALTILALTEALWLAE